MKKLFALSVTLNLALLGITGVVISTQFRAEREQPRLNPVAPPQGAAMKSESNAPMPLAATAFHWSQLEADDYPSYISNLRKIGCPEATIQRLVTSEVHDTYAEKRRELEMKVSGRAAPQTLAAEIKKMEKEEAALLGNVFQPSVAPSSSSQGDGGAAVSAGFDSTPTYAELTARVPRVQTVFMPLALQIADAEAAPATASNSTPDNNATPLNDAQRESVESSRKEFVDAIGGEKQDPRNPEYLRRWQKAQWVAEEQLRAQLGDELYNRMQIQAAQREYRGAGVR